MNTEDQMKRDLHAAKETLAKGRLTFWKFMFKAHTFGNNSWWKIYGIWAITVFGLYCCIATWNDGGKWVAMFLGALQVLLFWGLWAMRFRWVLNSERGLDWRYINTSNDYDWWWIATFSDYKPNPGHYRAGTIAYLFELSVFLGSVAGMVLLHYP